MVLLMARCWKAWITPTREITDVIYEIPNSLVKDYWRKQRPDLFPDQHGPQNRGGTTKNDRETARDLSERRWRMGVTGCIQCVEMRQREIDMHRSEKKFSAICSAIMEAKEYKLNFTLEASRTHVVERLISGTCTCIAALNCNYPPVANTCWLLCMPCCL